MTRRIRARAGDALGGLAAIDVDARARLRGRPRLAVTRRRPHRRIRPMADDQQLEQELAALLEQEWFEPPADFRAQARITDLSEHEAAERDPVGWWERQARELDWFEPWTTGAGRQRAAVLPVVHRRQAERLAQLPGPPRRGGPRRARRLPLARRGGREAARSPTRSCWRDVQRCANALKARGIGPGDVVGIYLPMIPEVIVAMLACTRIGAPHNVVFGGFSAESVAERMDVQQRERADHGRRRAAQGEDGAGQVDGRRGDGRPDAPGDDPRRAAHR